MKALNLEQMESVQGGTTKAKLSACGIAIGVAVVATVATVGTLGIIGGLLGAAYCFTS
jgi:hypothetical protein